MHKMLALFDHMFDEAKDGRSYVECAIKCKDTDRALSETYAQMARERMDALKRLKQQCTRLYEDKVRQAEGIGQDTKHLTEVHEWAFAKVAHEECELSKLMESVR